MTSRVRQAVLRILLLTEEFSPEELADAASIIGEKREDLLTFLREGTRAAKRASAQRAGPAASMGSRETRPLQELKSVDPAKYQMLRNFEKAVRTGDLLKTLDDYRAFGTILGKDFAPGKSRKDALTRLMALLATMDIDSIRSALSRIPTKNGQEETAFRRLANQIISGQPNPTSND